MDFKFVPFGFKTQKRMNASDAFRELYFAYEGYQIDLPTMLSLAGEFCDIKNKSTFWDIAKDFEQSAEYTAELIKQPYEFFELPKRCGGLPEEYHFIVEYMDEHFPPEQFSEEEQFNRAMCELNMFCEYGLFKRWQLLAEGKPKPRKPIPYDFNISEFRKKYSNPQQ